MAAPGPCCQCVIVRVTPLKLRHFSARQEASSLFTINPRVIKDEANFIAPQSVASPSQWPHSVRSPAALSPSLLRQASAALFVSRPVGVYSSVRQRATTGPWRTLIDLTHRGSYSVALSGTTHCAGQLTRPGTCRHDHATSKEKNPAHDEARRPRPGGGRMSGLSAQGGTCACLGLHWPSR